MELVNYPDYLIYEDGRVWSKKNNIFMKTSPNNIGYKAVTLCEDGKSKRVKLTTLQYEQKNICKYYHIIHTLFMGKPVFLFHCKVKGMGYKIFEERFKTLEKAMLYKFFFIMKINLGIID